MGRQAGLCGWVGDGSPDQVSRMLAAMAHRGGETVVVEGSGFALGRIARARTDGKVATPPEDRDAAIVGFCAGHVLGLTSSSSVVEQILRAVPADLRDLDGAFSVAAYRPASRDLVLCSDPFGHRTLFYAQHRGTFYFASELKALLSVDSLPVQMDLEAIHHYLTFSFVPGNATPVAGIRRIPPGHLARWHSGGLKLDPYAELRAPESVSHVGSYGCGAERVLEAVREAVQRRVFSGERLGVYLSGGLDSSAVAWALRDAGVAHEILSLSFGRHSVEHREARMVARYLGSKSRSVRVRGRSLRASFPDVVHKLDLPYGDPVTAPQYLLAQEARALDLDAVFNGEGGDQLFGGWSNKPMIAAALHGRADVHALLRTSHRFFGFENELYTPEFRSALGDRDDRSGFLQPYLEDPRDKSFLHRLRRSDIATRGARNLLPRAESMAAGAGLDVRSPLFDRALARVAFDLSPHQKLSGAREKHVLKQALLPHLPAEIVERPKSGMAPPVNRWIRCPMRGWVRALLSERSLRERGLFRPEFVTPLTRGIDREGEVRSRRVGEKVWALLMLEAWLRIFIDGRGRAPGSGAPMS